MGDRGLVVNHYNELSETVKLCSMYDILLEFTRIAEESGIAMNLESQNIISDHVVNYLETTRMAADINRLIGSPKLKILYDVYHMQLNEGNLCNNISEFIDQFGYVHVADVPGRHEPGTDEINYNKIYSLFEELCYQGRVGFDYSRRQQLPKQSKPSSRIK